MGEVFRAKDTRLDPTVAIKVALASVGESHLRERFDREARAVSSVSHPNICALFDGGHQDGVDEIWYQQPEGTWVAVRLVERSGLARDVSEARPLFRDEQIVSLEILPETTVSSGCASDFSNPRGAAGGRGCHLCVRRPPAEITS